MFSALRAPRSTGFVAGALSGLVGAVILLPAIAGHAATPGAAQELGVFGQVEVADGKGDRLARAFSRDAQGHAIRVVYPNMVAH